MYEHNIFNDTAVGKFRFGTLTLNNSKRIMIQVLVGGVFLRSLTRVGKAYVRVAARYEAE